MAQEPKNRLQARLNRIEGQVRGISRMIEEDRYCVDVLIQLAAVRAALDKAGLEILRNHTKMCVKDGIERGEGDAVVEELIAVIEKFIK